MKTPPNTFTLSYEFNAPRRLVFEAFGNAEALNEWWGPAESRNTVISLDFRPGGIFHFKMDFNGAISYGRFLFRTIRPHDLLEFTNAFADENARVVKAPFDIQLPPEIFYSLSFAENNGKTVLTLTGRPENGTDAEIEGFNAIHQNMQDGFAKTFGKLAEYLAR